MCPKISMSGKYCEGVSKKMVYLELIITNKIQGTPEIIQNTIPE